MTTIDLGVGGGSTSFGITSDNSTGMLNPMFCKGTQLKFMEILLSATGGGAI